MVTWFWRSVKINWSFGDIASQEGLITYLRIISEYLITILFFFLFIFSTYYYVTYSKMWEILEVDKNCSVVRQTSRFIFWRKFVNWYILYSFITFLRILILVFSYCSVTYMYTYMYTFTYMYKKVACTNVISYVQKKEAEIFADYNNNNCWKDFIVLLRKTLVDW